MLKTPIPFKKTARKKLLPVVLLLDCSGSMHKCKDELNTAIRNMLQDFCDNNNTQNYQIKVAIISFGDKVQVQSFETPEKLLENWQDLEPYGKTALGAALGELYALLADRNNYPSPSFQPVVCLISDGIASDFDLMVKNLKLLLTSCPPMEKSVRFALEIGSQCDHVLMDVFLSKSRNDGFVKHISEFKPNEIKDFLETMTRTTIARAETTESLANSANSQKRVNINFSVKQKL